MLNEVAPQIGIFWIIGQGKNAIIADLAEPMQTSTEIAGFRDSPNDHIRSWPQIRALHPDASGKEYDDVPRGRVVYNTTEKKYKVFVPPGTTKMIQNKILSAFSLPTAATVFIDDEHYGKPSDVIWDD